MSSLLFKGAAAAGSGVKVTNHLITTSTLGDYIGFSPGNGTIDPAQIGPWTFRMVADNNATAKGVVQINGANVPQSAIVQCGLFGGTFYQGANAVYAQGPTYAEWIFFGKFGFSMGFNGNLVMYGQY